jgi:hypothetical protein
VLTSSATDTQSIRVASHLKNGNISDGSRQCLRPHPSEQTRHSGDPSG